MVEELRRLPEGVPAHHGLRPSELYEGSRASREGKYHTDHEDLKNVGLRDFVWVKRAAQSCCDAYFYRV